MNTLSVFRKTIVFSCLVLSGFSTLADTVVLNSDQTDYTFQAGNTYYLTDSVHVSGTATFQGGAVIKYAPQAGQLFVQAVEAQGTTANPTIFTGRDDDRFGDVVSGSTHSPSGYYAYAGLEVDCVDACSLEGMQFYYFQSAVLFANQSDVDLSHHISDLVIRYCGAGFECQSFWSGLNSLSLTNLTLSDCSDFIAGGYMTQGTAVNSTFNNVGGLVSDEWGYGFYPFIFTWCNFSDVDLNAFEVDISGDYNGFADCGNFSNYDYNYGSWSGTNYFGSHWYRLTNSLIQFALDTPSSSISQQVVPVTVNLASGTVFFQSILVTTNVPTSTFIPDDTSPLPPVDFSSATWTDYASSNLLVDLGSLKNGVYQIWVGLAGARDYPPVWQKVEVVLDTNAPVVKITSPSLTTLGIPLLQVKGEGNEELGDVTFSISNSVQVSTLQQGFVLQRFFDTNQWDFTTNYFQCFDLHLAAGLNLVTIHATDLAGNTAVTNLYVTLNYAVRTNAPVMRFVFPQDGMKVVGTNFTANGYVDDPTATIAAQLLDSTGTTRTFTGDVERTGRFWVDNMPLNSGTNRLTLTITDAAGHVTVTNISVIKSPETFTMYPLPDYCLAQALTTVQGSVSVPTARVVVNGVPAETVSGVWTANNVPVTHGGVAVFNLTAYSSATGGGASTNNADENLPLPNSVNAQVTCFKPPVTFTVVNDQQTADFYEHLYITNVDHVTDAKKFQHYNQYWMPGQGGKGFETNRDFVIDYSWNGGGWVSETNPWVLGSVYSWVTWTNTLYPYTDMFATPTDLAMHALLGYEHCDVWSNPDPVDTVSQDYLVSYTRHYRRIAQTTVNITVSGRANSGKFKEVFIYGWARDIDNIELRNTGGGASPSTYALIWGLPSMPYPMITIGGFGRLDASGCLAVILPAGLEAEVTPAVKRHPFYTFQVWGTASDYN